MRAMKRTTHTLTMLALLLSASAALCQDAGSEWNALNQEAVSLYQKGQYDRAVVVARQALELAERTVGPGDPNTAASLNSLALLYATQGDYAKAEPLYKRALAIDEKALGPDHPSVATTLDNLAALYRVTDRHEEAEALEQRAARIREIER